MIQTSRVITDSNLSIAKKSALEIAKIIESYSLIHCKGGVIDREDCQWYHGSWKYLKYLDLVSCPEWHFDFYTSTIKSVINSLNRDIAILICGAADDGTFSVVAHAVQSADHYAKITVMDMCSTPVYASLLYAKENNIEHTHGTQAIVPNTPFPSNHFDIIVTDAFLTRFLKHERLEITSEWCRILRPGGLVITTTRVEKSITETVLANEEAQKDYVTTAQELSLAKGLDVMDIVNRAKVYAERITSHPFESVEEIKILFQGFELDATIADSEFVEIIPRKYARIVAKKKEVLIENI